ncbi:MAG: glycine betaine ABC transporter substrate-binding protein [Desulfuromonadales bacterium]
MGNILYVLLLAFAILIPPPSSAVEEELRVGSKKFTEGVITGELATQLIRSTGTPTVHRREMGGTRVLWSALHSGDIDVYPEYTGTISQEILAGEEIPDENAMRRALARLGVAMSEPLGFNNTYALGMEEEKAEALGIRTISDLREHPDLVFGFSNEFLDRQDGWPGLQAHYNLPQGNKVRGLDHDLAYRGLESGTIDVTDLYSTDAEIAYYELRVLEDDRSYFPQYEALWLYREELVERNPEAVAALERLEGRISEDEMVAMNADAKLEKVPEATVAAEFLENELDQVSTALQSGTWQRFWRYTRQHLVLVGISLGAAIAVGIPFGILAAARPRCGQFILAGAGVIQTIPSLALLVFMIPLLGIGGPPAIVALFLYSLLPIIRNTYTGLHDIPRQVQESAEALGLPPGARMRLVELPLAASTILAGIKISAVINIGTATLGALIGAGGYGQPILTGIRLDDIGLILWGAVPAALLALLAQGVFELLELAIVPRGLRLKVER